MQMEKITLPQPRRAISTFPRSSFSRSTRAAPKRHPALVWVHEDIRGHLYEHYIPFIREATARGYVVIAPEYRGSIGYGRRSTMRSTTAAPRSTTW